ncbi:MAG: AraC family transcriptional regulator [Rikenellaceae bacterium]|jgi:AraC-like DNA-binding protein|nr:AraC family transcriptional regulator [Rikenellaceae bacterium]
MDEIDPKTTSLLKYLVANEMDEQWGLTVTTAGYHRIRRVSVYPPTRDHPTPYYFDHKKGRVLGEFQLVYLTRGKGAFQSKHLGPTRVNEGDMFLLFPGEWHTYRPDADGWDEYWIGFKGDVADHWVRNRFFSPASPLFYIGIDEGVTDLYNQAIEAASSEKAGFQQLLAGIVAHLLGTVYSNQRDHQFADKEIIHKINKAKAMMQENIFLPLSAEEIARRLNLSYSWFRRTFKEYTGFAPAKYMNELKLQKAKAFLVTSDKSIKEISILLLFENVEYFSTFFKKATGKTPLQYRVHSTKFLKSHE